MGFENGKLLRVSIVALDAAGDQEVNTLHYDLQDAIDGTNNPQTLADDFRDDVMPEFAALYDSTWQIQPVIVMEEKDPQHPTDPRSEWTSGVAIPGTRVVTGDNLPRALCAVATLKTANIGRRFRGRMFLGGSTAEGDLNYETWQASMNTLWNAFLNAIPREPDLVGGVSEASAHWCVYSRTQRALNLDPYAPAISSVILRTQPHWLRSRDPRV